MEEGVEPANLCLNVPVVIFLCISRRSTDDAYAKRVSLAPKNPSISFPGNGAKKFLLQS